jgi:uncharacterized membrane protein
VTREILVETMGAAFAYHREVARGRVYAWNALAIAVLGALFGAAFGFDHLLAVVVAVVLMVAAVLVWIARIQDRVDRAGERHRAEAWARHRRAQLTPVPEPAHEREAA